MNIKCFVLGVCGANCYIVSDDNKNCVIVDPADNGEQLWEYIKAQGLNLLSVFVTHSHFDHIYGLNALYDSAKKEGSTFCVYIHHDDADALYNIDKNLSGTLFGTPFKYTGTHIDASDGDIIKVGDMSFKVVSTPGHTPGSACFVEEGERVMFSGDTLFQNSIGRTDFPGGNMKNMNESLRRLCSLDGDYEVYPGHGNKTTLDEERRFNPFIV